MWMWTRNGITVVISISLTRRPFLNDEREQNHRSATNKQCRCLGAVFVRRSILVFFVSPKIGMRCICTVRCSHVIGKLPYRYTRSTSVPHTDDDEAKKQTTNCGILGESWGPLIYIAENCSGAMPSNAMTARYRSLQ